MPRVRRGEWPTPSTPVLHGKTFGIIGLGRVGRHVARLGRGVRHAGARLEPAPDAGASRRRPAPSIASSTTCCAESDVVTIHASLNACLARPDRCPPPGTAEADGLPDQHRARPHRRRSRAGAGAARRVGSPAPGSTCSTPSRCRQAIRSRRCRTSCCRRTSAGRPTTGTQRFSADACDVLLAFMDGRDVPRFDADRAAT